MNAGFDMSAGRILLDFVEQEDFQARVLERSGGPLRMAGGFEARIGDEEDAGIAEFAGEFAEAIEATGTEHHARRRVEVERLQRPGGRRWMDVRLHRAEPDGKDANRVDENAASARRGVFHHLTEIDGKAERDFDGEEE